MSNLFDLLKLKLELPLKTVGRIVEVRLGATRQEGGTRGRTISIGGSVSLPFFSDREPAIAPVVAMLVLDDVSGLPTQVKDTLGEVVESPAEWAKACAEEFAADAIALHLVSTDPSAENRSAREAARTVEQVLREVDVPLIVYGSGKSKKDSEVLAEVAAAANGERCFLGPVTLSSDMEGIVKVGLERGHSLIAETDCDPTSQRTLNRNLMELGLPQDRLVMNPTTAALGLGVEYSISIIEQIRLDALKGDASLQMPIATIRALAYSWTAREAWAEDPRLGDVEKRGPMWETHTAIALLLSGADLVAVFHPQTALTLKEVVGSLLSQRTPTLQCGEWFGD